MSEVIATQGAPFRILWRDRSFLGRDVVVLDVDADPSVGGGGSPRLALGVVGIPLDIVGTVTINGVAPGVTGITLTATDSEIGIDAVASGGGTLAVGGSASATFAASTAIGHEATVAGPRSIIVGRGAFEGGALGSNILVSVGGVIGTDGQGNIGMGNDCSHEGSFNLSLIPQNDGIGGSVTGTLRNIILGWHAAGHSSCNDTIVAGAAATVTGSSAIALGARASAPANTMMVGPTTNGTGTIKTFQVNDGVNVPPIKATNVPASVAADGDTGLFIACKVGGVIVQKQLKFDPVTGVVSVVIP